MGKRNPATATLPLGVVIRKRPGATRWAAWSWQAVSVLPGAGPAEWRELRSEGDVVEYHAATLPLTLYSSDTEAYLTGLSDTPPAIYVVLRAGENPQAPYDVLLVTASPFEGQDYADNGEDVVEKVAMPSGLIAWIEEFIEDHHEEEVFIKRRRDKARVDLKDDGIGDARIRQLADVYRAPARRKVVQ